MHQGHVCTSVFTASDVGIPCLVMLKMLDAEKYNSRLENHHYCAIHHRRVGTTL